MHRFLALGLAAALVGGCGTVAKQPTPAEPDPKVRQAQEIKDLFAQPFIDPLTRYLQQYANDKTRGDDLNKVAAERNRRCADIAARFAEQPKTEATLNKYRGGYAFSCPREVQAFAAQVPQAPPETRTTEPSVPKAAQDTASPRSAELQRQLNDCYLLATIMNYGEAAVQCQPPADAGDVKAQYYMAVIARARKQYPEAMTWAQKAAPKSSEAAYLVGQLHASGQGVPANPGEALKWYERAAEQGGADAQRSLGLAYMRGEGVPVSFEKASAWLLKSARQGSAQACFHLGELYENGTWAGRDPPLALAWYELASRNGSREAAARVQTMQGRIGQPQIGAARIKVRQALAGGSP